MRQKINLKYVAFLLVWFNKSISFRKINDKNISNFHKMLKKYVRYLIKKAING